MRRKNKKVYIIALIILIFAFIYNAFIEFPLFMNYGIFIRFTFWITLLVFVNMFFGRIYIRNKYKKELLKYVILISLLYVIIYQLLGYFVGFQRSPLSFTFLSIIINLITYVGIRIVQEFIKYKLIVENKSMISYVIITILFIYAYINVLTLTGLADDKVALFKYFSSTIVPLICTGLLSTYLMIHADFKAAIIYQIVPIIVAYTIPFGPNLDWYMFGIYNIVFAFLTFIIIRYRVMFYNDEKIKLSSKKNSLFSTIPLLIIFVILILFVIGVFKYVPVAVMSNSMYPYYSRGDTLVYEKINSVKNLKSGDIICYKYDSILVMHRIVKIETKKNKILITTKGDNIDNNDPMKVEEEQVIGKIRVVIPKIGYPSVWLYETLRK